MHWWVENTQQCCITKGPYPFDLGFGASFGTSAATRSSECYANLKSRPLISTALGLKYPNFVATFKTASCWEQVIYVSYSQPL